MAEVYGIKPKIFTKDWWPYYWMYYKWHTIAILFIAMLVVIGVVSCVRKINPDLGVVYCSGKYYDETAWDAVEQAINADIDDINSDDETHTIIMPLVFNDADEYAEQNYALSIKHTASFTEKTNYVYIYDKEFVEANIMNEDADVTFHTTDKWLNVDVAEDRVVYGYDGKPYAVSLKDSAMLNAAGIDGADLYVLIKYDTDSPYRNEQAYDNAVIAANNMIK